MTTKTYQQEADHQKMRFNQLRDYGLTDFIVTYGIICIFYRASIGIESIYSNNIAGITNFAVLALGLFEDLMIGVVLFIPCYFIKNNLIRNFSLLLILIFSAINFTANKKLFLLLASHFSYSSIVTTLDNGFTLKYFIPFMNMNDWALLFSPLIILLLLKLAKTKWVDGLLFYFIAPAILAALSFGLLVFSWYSIPLSLATHVVFYPNPLRYMTTDFYRSLHNRYVDAKKLPSARQMNSIAFIDPEFTNNNHIMMPALPSKQLSEWNVVMVVLESVGSHYIFDTSRHNDMPMPFLHDLSKKGLWLSNHYSTGNNSPIGAFGLFSGIYPSPLPTHAMMRSDIVIPNMATWLGKKYDSFFITSADARIYFPKRFMTNTGFKEFYDANNLPLKNKKFLYNMYLSDLTVLDFFLSRIESAHQPFLAVYWPCATHHPYVPYPNQKSILNDTSHPFSRYMNNLNVMDYQLSEIMKFLEKKHLADKTIFIVVGDHGESFGQHLGQQGAWMHGGALFQEQIQVPALFYQPRLFKPQEITQPTSTVDLLPTLLDAMQIAYPANRFQGESLLRPKNRKYVFVYGENNELAAIDPNQVKTQISFYEGECVRFDLAKDPKEQRPLNCIAATEDTMIKYHNYQPAIFEAYNSELQKPESSKY